MLCQQNHFCHFSWTVVFVTAFPVQTRCAWIKVPLLAGRVIFCYQSFSKRGIYSHKITLNLFYTRTNMVPTYYRNAPLPRVLVPNHRNNKLVASLAWGQPRCLSGLRRIRVHSLWLLVDHFVLRNWDRILVRAVKGLISRAGMSRYVRYCDKEETLNSNKQTH